MHRLILIGVVLGVLSEVAQPATAGGCDISAGALDRGERRAFLICGEGLGEASVLEGLVPAGIEVLYRQNLRRCDVGEKRPGIYLVLKARPDAQSSELFIRNRAADATTCGPLPIEVPDRRLLPPATLQPLREHGPHSYRLRLTLPEIPNLNERCESLSLTVEPDSFVVLPKADGAIQCASPSLELRGRHLCRAPSPDLAGRHAGIRGSIRGD